MSPSNSTTNHGFRSAAVPVADPPSTALKTSSHTSSEHKNSSSEIAAQIPPSSSMGEETSGNSKELYVKAKEVGQQSDPSPKASEVPVQQSQQQQQQQQPQGQQQQQQQQQPQAEPRQVGGIFQLANINRVSISNQWKPFEADTQTLMTYETENDENWPKMNNAPVNNRQGPKKINLEKALTQPKTKRSWKAMDMMNRAESGKAKERMIAGITKTSTAKGKKPPMETIKEIMIAPVDKNGPSLCQMKCHVTNATKYLASVGKMTQQGNRVIFDSDRSYIQSKKTGLEMDMIYEQGVYKLDVVFMNGDTAERGVIVIDSGAADNVMPAAGLSEVALQPKEQGVNFTSADGSPMDNHGRKDVQFIPFEFWESETGYPFRGQAE